MDWVTISSVFIIAVILNVKSSYGLKCHVCNSRVHKGCTDLPDKQKYAQECLPTQKMCRKINQEIDDEVRVIRQCATRGSNMCDSKRGFNKIRVEYCHCDTNLCNHGSQTAKFAFIPVLSGLLIYWVYIAL